MEIIISILKVVGCALLGALAVEYLWYGRRRKLNRIEEKEVSSYPIVYTDESCPDCGATIIPKYECLLCKDNPPREVK